MSDSLAHFLSGAGGGVAATAVTYPLLNLATRLQVQDKGHEHRSFKDLLGEDGIKGLYA